ncbi:DnaA/Hda family protein [Paracoccus sp. TK19116]|uniref:DnaA/Hda family protein n=1 Tax=Paracoccus albicereus TaxID=2922394 RepID=A0ABT1MTV6_9RHOB|nr:DnaA/Hda family protein [Paracoccus albicereus]MCQ0971752.1 DnaA/Hda family protein [Paracoccus albicereus]
MSRQLVLDLDIPPAQSRADWLVAGSNRDALAMLDAPESWPQGRLLLIGPEGAGKSHVAAFWAAERDASTIAATDLNADDADRLARTRGALVVEDADRIGGQDEAERALFHLWNLAPTRDCLLLLTARTPPRDWGLLLPDLRSRVDALTQARLGPPDQALLAAVLVKLFADRQLDVGPGLIDWLALRMDRDLGLARHLVHALDRTALSEGRRVTRPMAAELLDRLTPDDETELPSRR